MIASAQTLRRLRPYLITPFHEKTIHSGMSYGLTAAGYDIRVRENFTILPGGFALVSTLDRFDMPNNLLGVVHDKSTWARRGVVTQNTIIEPGWHGFLTLELSNHSDTEYYIEAGSPIAQVIFHILDEPTDTPYTGKYQDQGPRPQPPLFE